MEDMVLQGTKNAELHNRKPEKLEKSSAKDLTVGSPTKLIIGFAVPMLLGLLFQQLYSMVDTMIVGRYLGVNPFAGVGATSCVNFMVLGFCMGLCSGFAVLVAQKFGAKDYDGLRRVVANSAWLCLIIGTIITVLVVIFCKPILRLMNTPEDIFIYAYHYIVVIFAGIPFLILYNITAAIIRSLGDSKSPIIFLAIASVLNIVLDYVLIVNVGMNVEGAALATVIAQGFSGIVSIFYMRKKFPVLHFKKGDLRPRIEIMLSLLGVGVPMGLQYSITAIGTVVLQTAVNGLGSVYVAAVTAGNKIYSLLTCPIDALGQTMAPYAGQNVGANKIDRVGKGLKSASICGFVVSAVILGIALLWGREFTLLFLDERNEQVMELSYHFLVIIVSFACLLTLVNTVRFTIQGMGYSAFAIIAGVMEMIARVLAAVILVPIIGYTGACLASPLAWVFADIFLIPAFFYCKKRITRKIGQS
jgi:putative MATE family efflux protein